MLCDRCHGNRFVLEPIEDAPADMVAAMKVPCPQCGGIGSVSCCGDPGDCDEAEGE